MENKIRISSSSYEYDEDELKRLNVSFVAMNDEGMFLNGSVSLKTEDIIKSDVENLNIPVAKALKKYFEEVAK